MQHWQSSRCQYYLNEKETTALYQSSKVTMPKMSNISDGFVSSIRDADSPCQAVRWAKLLCKRKTKLLSEKTSEIAQIRRIAETAQLVAEEASTKNGKFNRFYYYEAPVRYRGETFNVYLNVGVAKNDATNHIYDITQKLRENAQPVAVGRLSKSFALGSGISDKSIYSTSGNVNVRG